MQNSYFFPASLNCHPLKFNCLTKCNKKDAPFNFWGACSFYQVQGCVNNFFTYPAQLPGTFFLGILWAELPRHENIRKHIIWMEIQEGGTICEWLTVQIHPPWLTPMVQRTISDFVTMGWGKLLGTFPINAAFGPRIMMDLWPDAAVYWQTNNTTNRSELKDHFSRGTKRLWRLRIRVVDQFRHDTLILLYNII